MLQESLLNLRQRVEALFRDKGYKEACIERYNHTWDHLWNFMSKKGVVLYTRELGKSFLDTRYGGKSFIELTKRQQECVRHIEVLTQMLETGTVHRSRVTPKKIVFAGPEGVLFNQFLSAETEYKRSSSVQRYEERLYNLYTFLCEKHIFLSDMTPSVLMEYVSHLDYVKSAPDRDNIIMTTRIFFRYLCANRQLSDNREELWMSLMKIKGHYNTHIPTVYTEEEIERMIQSIDRGSSQGKRDYAMILLAARYGLRVSDIIGLRFVNLDWDHDRICIIQKKTEKRVVLPLSDEVGEAIIDYIRHGRPEVDSPCVFLTVQAPYKPLGSNILVSRIKDCAARANIVVNGRKTGPHALRHSLATNLLKASTSLPVISEILGHSSTESTKTYLRVNIDLLRQCALEVPFVPSSFYDNLYGYTD